MDRLQLTTVFKKSIPSILPKEMDNSITFQSLNTPVKYQSMKEIESQDNIQTC